MRNIRQQVVDAACWIARAASNVSVQHSDLRSTFMRHDVTEHRDFQILEANYVATGGTYEEIKADDKNIALEALHGYLWLLKRQKMSGVLRGERGEQHSAGSACCASIMLLMWDIYPQKTGAISLK